MPENTNSRSIPGSQHFTQPQNVKDFVPPLFGWSRHQDTMVFQGAQDVTITGSPIFTNIGTNTGVHNVTTVNNLYGGAHGLENLKESVSFAALHDSSEQDPDRRCHPRTRESVLTQLRDWIGNADTTDPIFWLYGPAGAGKSAIAQTFAHEYKERGVVATFFFYRSDAKRNDGNRLFPTLAWQLAFSIPLIKDVIIRVLDKTPHLPRKNIETQFEQLVVHPFQTISASSQMPQVSPVVIIDGVDECFDEQLQRRFLTVIGNAVKEHHVPLRFLICSRPEALIEEVLNKFKDFIVRIDLATRNDSHRDIEKYLVDKFLEIGSKHGLDLRWPGQEIIEEIVFKSSGNFILASVIIRFIGDEDCYPESQLDIVRKLRPQGRMSPFGLLDDLYLEILKRQPDQHFLKTFLAFFVGRSFIEYYYHHGDEPILMNVSEKELHIKLRRMRSLLKFDPFIDVYHKSFFDFLQDPSRSGQYHVSKQGGLRRYLELIVDFVVRHVSLAIEQPDCHKKCRFNYNLKFLVTNYPPKIQLPVEDWQEALKPLLLFQDKLLKMSKPQPCRITQLMRDLLLHLVILQGRSQPIDVTRPMKPSVNNLCTKWSSTPVTEVSHTIFENDLDGHLSMLLSCSQKINSVSTVDEKITDCLSSLLTFDYAEIAARVQSISDTQKLIELIDSLINNEHFLSHCGPNAARKVACLASAIFANVPVLPRSLFTNQRGHDILVPEKTLEFRCQIAIISRILDHNYIVPLSGSLVLDDENKQNQSVYAWLEISKSNLVTRVRAILGIAKTIHYFHSMNVVLNSYWIVKDHFVLDLNLHAKFKFRGLFAWWVREAFIYDHEESRLLAAYTYEANISAFAHLFHLVCFDGYKGEISNRLVEDARLLIERCHATDCKSQPTMEEVVTEMETWDLI